MCESYIFACIIVNEIWILKTCFRKMIGCPEHEEQECIECGVRSKGAKGD